MTAGTISSGLMIQAQASGAKNQYVSMKDDGHKALIRLDGRETLMAAEAAVNYAEPVTEEVRRLLTGSMADEAAETAFFGEDSLYELPLPEELNQELTEEELGLRIFIQKAAVQTPDYVVTDTSTQLVPGGKLSAEEHRATASDLILLPDAESMKSASAPAEMNRNGEQYYRLTGEEPVYFLFSNKSGKNKAFEVEISRKKVVSGSVSGGKGAPGQALEAATASVISAKAQESGQEASASDLDETADTEQGYRENFAAAGIYKVQLKDLYDVYTAVGGDFTVRVFLEKNYHFGMLDGIAGAPGLYARQVEDQAELQAVVDQLLNNGSIAEEEAGQVSALDISFRRHADDGKELEPDADAIFNVQISLDKTADDDGELRVLHILSEDRVETVATGEGRPSAAGSEADEYIRDEDAAGEGLPYGARLDAVANRVMETGDGIVANFETGSFSVYPIIGTGEDETPVRRTYQFQKANGDPYYFKNAAGNVQTSQMIKNGESLQDVGVPDVAAGQHFISWRIYDTKQHKWGAQVVFDTPLEVTKKEEVVVRPYCGDVVYLTFYADPEGSYILDRVQLPVENGSAHYDLNDISAPSPKSDMTFAGWSEEKGVNDDNRAPITGTALIVDTDQNHAYYPIFKSGHWISFETAEKGSGATYYTPVHILAGNTAQEAKPDSNPVWQGHVFAGWHTVRDDDPLAEPQDNTATQFDFDRVLTEDITLYAHWKAGEANYVVQFWRQMVNDDASKTNDADKVYEFVSQEERTGLAGSSLALTYADEHKSGGLFTGCEYSEARTQAEMQNVTITPDGKTVVRVYYNRQLITMRFLDDPYISLYGPPTYNSSLWNNENAVRIFRGLYGAEASPALKAIWAEGRWGYYDSSYENIFMSYLGQYILPGNVADPNHREIRLYLFNRAQNMRISFFLEEVDGNIPDTPEASARGVTNATFNFTEKFDGYTVSGYRIKYRNRDVSGHFTPVSVGDSIRLNENAAELQILYKRLSYRVNLLNAEDGAPITAKEVTNNPLTLRYGQSFADLKPGAQADDTTLPQTLTPPHSWLGWNGSWYSAQSCRDTENPERDAEGYVIPAGNGEEVDFTRTMPNHDVNLYVKWDAVWYWVKLEPEEGELSDTESTYFWVNHEEPIQAYEDFSRNYIEDPAGDWYYHYDEFNTDDPNGTQPQTRDAYYTQDQSLSTNNKRYRKEAGAYSLVGWYRETRDGREVPYNFHLETDVTDDILTVNKPNEDNRGLILRAKWRRAGEYRVAYSLEGVDPDGHPLYLKDMPETDENRVRGTDAPIDTFTYADASNSAISADKITPPENYIFSGWYYRRENENAQDEAHKWVYNPGDAFTVDASLADSNKTIWIYPIFTRLDEIPIETTSLVFDANEGKTSLASADNEGQSVHRVVSKDPDVVREEHLELNTAFKLYGADAFYRDGYQLAGWSEVKDTNYTVFDQDNPALLPAGCFRAGQKIGTDNKASGGNVLYAIWEPKLYKVTVKKKVDGNAADISRSFTFTPNFAGSFGEDYQKNFSLSGEDGDNTKEFMEVPFGTAFSITEGSSPDGDFQIDQVTCTVTDADNQADNAASQVQNGQSLTVTGNMLLEFTNVRAQHTLMMTKTDAEDTSLGIAGAEFTLEGQNSGAGESAVHYDLISDAAGTVLLKGGGEVLTLPLGDYRLTETVAPIGYLMMDEPVTIHVTRSSITIDQSELADVKALDGDQQAEYLLNVRNKPGQELPKTGGSGTWPWTAAGLLTALAGVLYVFFIRQRGERGMVH